MRVAYITNSPEHSGVGQQARAIEGGVAEISSSIKLTRFHIDSVRGTLTQNGVVRRHVHALPQPFNRKAVTWIRLGKKLKRELRTLPPYDIYHATNQTVSFIVPPFSRPVVTVHDLIEVVAPQQPLTRFISHYLYGGIRSASHLIAVSHYTATTLQSYFRIPAERITVIHNGVSPAFHHISGFRSTIAYQTLWLELKLSDHHPIVLYVGSDHPRKNALAAIEAFARLKRKRPDALFIKVGEAGIGAGRVTLQRRIDQLGLGRAVRFIAGGITDSQLNDLYNCADVFIFPSRFEGFGLPLLEAMACGVPIIAARATSIPEVVGDAALLREPNDVEGLASDLIRVTTDKKLADTLRERGWRRARQFSWQKAARETFEVYRRVASSS